MWLNIVSIFVFTCVSLCESAGGDKDLVFRKCCPENKSLIRLHSYTDFEDRYECVDANTILRNYNVSKFSSILVTDSVIIDDRLPENCDKLEMNIISGLYTRLINSDFTCYDKLILDIENATIIKNIPATVSLTCVTEKSAESQSKLSINNIRKCCPPGQSFDNEYHTCRILSDPENVKDWFTRLLNISNNYIYDVEFGLHCKNHEYSVELTEIYFALNIEGNFLSYDGRNGKGVLPQGKWCIDTKHGSAGVVARACTEECSSFGAFCFRKCCPLGKHYKPFRCGSWRSVCVPDVEDMDYFNVSAYLDPLKSDDKDSLTDVLGLRINLECSHGKFALNKSSSSLADHHELSRDGNLIAQKIDPYNYCLEAFDLQDCPGPDIMVTGIACFQAMPWYVDFTISAMINIISAICLTLTFIIYCSLAELRNLHGKTIISHVSTLCFGYACLARAQYNEVKDNKLCTMIGYGIYFGFVGGFVWLNVMCFDIWWTFGTIRTVQPLRKAGTERRKFIWYSLYAWGLTMLLTLVMLVLDKYPVAKVLDANMGVGMCWFGSIQNTPDDWPHYIFFVIPMGLLTGINLILWLLTSRHCARVKSEVHRLQAGSIGDRAKKRFRVDQANYILTGKLWVVMGVGWFTELLSTLSWLHEPPWLWRIIDLINQLQGVFIFLILVCKLKIYHLIKKRLGLEKPDALKNATSSSTRTSSTFLSRTISSDERTNLRASLPNNGIKRA